MSNWRKSRYSSNTGQCVEVSGWRKSTKSRSNGECVEAGQGCGAVAVRDTMDRGGAVLAFGPAAWAAFTTSLKG